MTPHDMRSGFRQWFLSQGVPREVAQAALAHGVALNPVEEAYLHRDKALFDKRVDPMQEWAKFSTQPTAATAKVVNIKSIHKNE